MEAVGREMVCTVLATRYFLKKSDLSYREALLKVSELTPEQKQELTGTVNHIESWQNLFESDTVWYETTLLPDVHFVNKIFPELASVEGSLGKTMQELLYEYNNGELAAKDANTINAIRQNLSPHPPVLALTTDWKEFVIYDGWHTATAFILENKPIPAYVGHAKDFSIFKV